MLAQGWTASEPATGDFYLYNVGANAYLENGASWGTHAALKSSGFVVNITANNGVYTIGTNSKYSGKFFTDNGYVDTGSSTNWLFEPVAGLTNTYKLKAANGNYAYAAAGMYNLEMGADPGTNKAYWKLVTAANRNDVTGASATNPIELTHKINNPRFDEYESNNNKNYVKNWPDGIAWGGNTGGTNNDVPSWDDRNPCGEHYNRTFDSYQELTGLANGTYAVSVQGFYREGGFAAAAPKHTGGTESLNAILYANAAEQPLMSIFEEAGKASGGGTATTDGINGVFPNNMSAASYFFSAGLYWNTVYVQVTDGTLKIGIKKSTAVGSDWTIFDNFRLQYFGDCTIAEAKFGALVVTLNEAVDVAQGFIDSNPALSTEQIAALQKIINDNDNDDGAFTEESQFTTAAETINNALAAYQAMVAPYAIFNALKPKANAIAAVEYTETTSGSHTTFTDAITAQTTAADNATSVADVTAATNALVAAIKTYIAGAEPKNDGEYFDITCLMTNPNFDDSHNGWTYLSAPGVNWSNCEYYENEFDINQTVTGLPTGSYSLSVQAYQRPGWAGNVYNDYINGTDNASSVLYINSITSNVKNIAADAQATYKLGDGSSFDWPNDSRVGTEGSYKYVPNSQQGANLWFAAGLYDATCAAVVDDAANGSLKLGFKSTKTHVSGDWTIFDNFRLYYYGSSLLVYYKQYLPQLKSEASADLSNALYNNVQGLERDEFTSALSATPATETEAAYKDVIDNIAEKQAAFRAAVTAYDALVAAKAASLTKISSNIGTGVFQFNEATNNSLYSSYETAKGNVDSYSVDGESTAADIQAIVDAYNTAVNNYNNQALNAPATGKRYNVSIVEDGKDWDGNAITFIVGARSDMGLYGIKYLASANANLNQALKFTAVEGEANTYKVSAINAETGDEQYITTGSTYEGGNNTQIRTTDDANKASWVKIAATTTDGQFQLLNVSDGNKVIANNNNNDMYTAGNANFTIAEAAQASVDIKISAEVKLATRIFPFAPTLPSDVVAYSCEAKGDEDVLTLVEVETPAANTPYILYAPDGYNGDALTGWGTAGAVQYTDGWLTGVYAATAAPVGSYVLQKNNSDVAFYKVAEGKQPTVGANRGYLTASAAEGARALYFDFGGETTGISTMQNALSTMHNELFDLQGRKVAQPAKGLYIKNGKKVIMK